MFKKNQILINLITNVLSMAISMLISLWITPYLINQLGLAAYGYIGLLNNTTNYIYIITYTLTSMVARFLTVAVEKNGPDEASKVMSSALFSSLLLGGLLIPFLLLAGINLQKLFNIENQFLIDVKIGFILGGITLIINSIYSVFSTGAYSKNRLDITNGIGILASLARIAFLVVIFSLFGARIWHVAVASVIQTVIILVLCVYTFIVLLPDIKFKISLFDTTMAIALLSSGFFNAVVLLGNNFLTQIDIIVGNRYLPAEIVGMYAAILLLPNSIRSIGSALSYAFSPTTIKLYSVGNMEELRIYTNRVVKYCGLMIGWPIAIVSGLAIPILNFWLNKSYTDYRYIIILMLLPLTINLGFNQLYIVQQATNKVKIPAIAACVFGVMNIILAVYFTAQLKMGIFGIVLSGVIMSTIRSAVFVPIYTAMITNQPKYAYYRGIISPIIATIITCATGLLIQEYFPIKSFLSIIYAAAVLTILYFLLSFNMLNGEERKFLAQKGLSLLRRQTAQPS